MRSNSDSNNNYEIAIVEFPTPYDTFREIINYVILRAKYEFLKFCMGSDMKRYNPHMHKELFSGKPINLKEYIKQLYPEVPSFS